MGRVPRKMHHINSIPKKRIGQGLYRLKGTEKNYGLTFISSCSTMGSLATGWVLWKLDLCYHLPGHSFTGLS